MDYSRNVEGRSDFIGGIDNEALDFGHLEQFIHIRTNLNDPTTHLDSGNDVSARDQSNVSAQSHLPESPPDSGSEPPYSPAELHTITLTNATNDDAIVAAGDNLNRPMTFMPLNVNVTHPTAVRRNLTSEMAALTDISDATIDLGVVPPDLQHGHLTPMYNDHLHMSAAAAATPIVGSITIRKHEDMLTGNVLPPADYRMPLLQHRVPSVDASIDHSTYRDVQTPQTNLLPHDTLTGIIPDDYCMGIISEPVKGPMPGTPAMNMRKRKFSNSGECGPPAIIKPEPIASSLSPACQQKLEPSSPINATSQQIGSPPSSTSTSPTSSSSFGSSIPSTVMPAANTSSSPSADANSLDGSQNPDSTDSSTPMQCIRFSVFQPQNWHHLCDQNLQELAIPHYRVDADKGFNFSNSDDAFVCQKKNHFQITCHAQLQGEATFVRTPTGLEKIKSFHLHFYGVKLEAPNQVIRVEQSQSDRSKKPFHPVPIDMQNHLVSKVTVGRLHFSETTSNNMRKKGRPNPEQRYFQLVVGLHAHTQSGHFPIISQGSERIIVRASNPGQFESDVELCWQRGMTPDSIFHAGRVGINTDHPDESLVIHGNLKVSGHIVQPSDIRAKQEIAELDTAQQLKNMQKIRVVRYRYEPEFALHSGLKAEVDTGVIAQEVREVLPDAVQEAGSIVLPSGQVIEKFLLVNKDRILMENIGAVKELCKVTGSLETRIEQLEKINTRLMRMQQSDRGSMCSTKKCKHSSDDGDEDNDEFCSNKTIQLIIIALVVIMAMCLVAISTLYFVEHGRQRFPKRYEHYELSQLIAHDSIVFNSKNRNSHLGYSLGRQPHLTNKNSKMIANAYTPRPAVQHAPEKIAAAATTSNPFDDFNHSGLSKTANSKNKIKWPIVASASVASVAFPLPLNDNSSDEDLDKLIAKETSSEKIADAINLPQDVENNSIDGDILQKAVTPNGSRVHTNKKSSLAEGSNAIGGGNDEVLSNGLNANDELGNRSTASHKRDDVVYAAAVYKKHREIEADSSNQQTDLVNDVPPSGNKSRADSEDTDLQYLSSNGEFDDRGFYEIASAAVVKKYIIHKPVGVSDDCNTRGAPKSHCRSACEETSKLNDSAIESDIYRNDNFSVSERFTNTTTGPVTNTPTTDSNKSHILDHDTKRKSNLGQKSIDCLLITPLLRADTFNASLDAEEVCPNSGQNYNITYAIPVSKYFNERSMELSLNSKGSATFQWKVCNYFVTDRTVHESKTLLPDSYGKPSQKYLNKAVFSITLPNNGFFEHLIELRATLDSPNKNVCVEPIEETNTILQYNIKIFRDCD